jgi:two-component system, LuxR family, response regulator FixJ
MARWNMQGRARRRGPERRGGKGSGMNVLVLDDHAAFRDEVVAMLICNGHKAFGVSMATSAIPLVESGEYDFVLVDYHMPAHDGVWFMKNTQWPRRTKAILVTAHVNPQVIDTMMKAGAAGYLVKPFEEEDLLRHLTFHAGDARPVRGNGGRRDGAPVGDVRGEGLSAPMEEGT